MAKRSARIALSATPFWGREMEARPTPPFRGQRSSIPWTWAISARLIAATVTPGASGHKSRRFLPQSNALASVRRAADLGEVIVVQRVARLGPALAVFSPA